MDNNFGCWIVGCELVCMWTGVVRDLQVVTSEDSLGVKMRYGPSIIALSGRLIVIPNSYPRSFLLPLVVSLTLQPSPSSFLAALAATPPTMAAALAVTPAPSCPSLLQLQTNDLHCCDIVDLAYSMFLTSNAAALLPPGQQHISLPFHHTARIQPV